MLVFSFCANRVERENEHFVPELLAAGASCAGSWEGSPPAAQASYRENSITTLRLGFRDVNTLDTRVRVGAGQELAHQGPRQVGVGGVNRRAR